MSGYQRINFKDQNVERPKTYDVTNNPDGSITLIESFGNVEELGTPINQENMNHIEDGIDAVSFSKFSLDLTYKKEDLVTDIQDDELKIFKSLKDNNFGHLPSEEDYWEEVEISGGGGLEIGDVAFTQMAIDESKGKRRKLNGQIIVQEQYQELTNILKASIAQNPDMACTEQEWQAEVTMSTAGICYKFVVDDEGGTIRLPKYPDYFVGSGNSPVIGTGLALGLTSGNKEFSLIARNGTWTNVPASNVMVTSPIGANVGVSIGSNPSVTSTIGVTSDPNKSGIETKVELIKGTYFIQVATGSETEDNIINTLELNNPFVLLEPKFFENEIYNISWLLANGTYNGSNAVHPSAYQALLVENNSEVAVGSTVTLPVGTNYTKRGLSVKLSTGSDITDYDFVVNTSDETFRLPIKVNLASGKAVVGNGNNLGLTVNDTDVILRGVTAEYTRLTVSTTGNNGSVGVAKVSTDPTKSGIELSDSNLYLYFYVGETVQNANLVNVGRIEEKLSNLIAITETYQNGTSWYRIYSDGWCEQGGYVGTRDDLFESRTVTLLKEFLNDEYAVVVGTVAGYDCKPSEKTATTITFTRTSTNDTAGMWVAYGYIA